MFEWFRLGGMVMVPIALCSVASLAIGFAFRGWRALAWGIADGLVSLRDSR